MGDSPPKPGDLITAVVTAVKPFGVFVDVAGVPGLVRGTRAVVGASIRVRVVEVDDSLRRFSAEIG